MILNVKYSLLRAERLESVPKKKGAALEQHPLTQRGRRSNYTVTTAEAVPENAI